MLFSDQILFQHEPALCGTVAAADLWELDYVRDAETQFSLN